MSEETNVETNALGDKAKELLAGVLERMGFEADIRADETEDKVTLEIECDGVERIIGRRGQVVDALQHLVGKMTYQQLGVARGEGKSIIVDAGGYRERHLERLESLAKKMIEKLGDGDRPVRLNPMSARDRRIIHMTVAELGGATTKSEGEGDDRCVVLFPVE